MAAGVAADLNYSGEPGNRGRARPGKAGRYCGRQSGSLPRGGRQASCLRQERASRIRSGMKPPGRIRKPAFAAGAGALFNRLRGCCRTCLMRRAGCQRATPKQPHGVCRTGALAAVRSITGPAREQSGPRRGHPGGRAAAERRCQRPAAALCVPGAPPTWPATICQGFEPPDNGLAAFYETSMINYIKYITARFFINLLFCHPPGHRAVSDLIRAGLSPS
jgi:hypothetical protein